jgi:hypothetical protein
MRMINNTTEKYLKKLIRETIENKNSEQLLNDFIDQLYEIRKTATKIRKFLISRGYKIISYGYEAYNDGTNNCPAFDFGIRISQMNMEERKELQEQLIKFDNSPDYDIIVGHNEIIIRTTKNQKQ